MRRNVCIMNRRYFFPIIILFAFLPLIPSVQAQPTPWQLFGKMCQFTSPNSPQCQQLLQQQQLAAAQQASQQQQSTTTADQTIPTIISLPIANAGVSQTVSSGASVSLSGADSTGSVSILNGYKTQATISSYAWTQVSGTTVLLNGANTATPTFTAPTVATTLVFSLTVTDSTGAVSSPDTVTVKVS
jgi:hypothetical protein